MSAPFKCLIQMVANLFEAHTAALFIRSSRGEDLRLIAYESLSLYLDPACRLQVGQGLVGWVAREGRALHVTHFDRDTRTLALYTQDAHIKSFLAVPLRKGLGVLMVDSKNRYAFPEKKQRILQDCADVAHVLWNAWQQECEVALFRRWLRWQKGLSGVAEPREVLAGLAEVLMLEAGLVALLDSDTQSYSVVTTTGLPAGIRLARDGFPVSRGLTGWVFRHGRGLVLHRTGADKERSYLLWPEEPFACGLTVVGIYVPGSPGHPAVACLLTGEADPAGWPEDLTELFVPSLGYVFSVKGAQS